MVHLPFDSKEFLTSQTHQGWKKHINTVEPHLMFSL